MTDASINSTTTTASRSSRRSTRGPGNELWSAKRTGLAGPMKSGWATPFMWQTGERTEIVTVGHGHVISYDTERQEAVAA